MINISIDPRQVGIHLSDNTLTQHIDLHEDFLDKTINGSHGPNSQFWENYIYSIIRLLRTVQRNVKTNGVNGYISIFPALLDVFFDLNLPNYVRCGTLF